jgi:hypothetical protein
MTFYFPQNGEKKVTDFEDILVFGNLFLVMAESTFLLMPSCSYPAMMQLELIASYTGLCQ